MVNTLRPGSIIHSPHQASAGLNLNSRNWLNWEGKSPGLETNQKTNSRIESMSKPAAPDCPEKKRHKLPGIENEAPKPDKIPETQVQSSYNHQNENCALANNLS